MEEASVAGESPDRSKQHESSTSSAEPTSGTPAAVPGPTRPTASASTSAPADPRLAVARETAPASRLERSEPVQADRATAVFSTRAVAARASGAEGSDSASGAEGSTGADAAGESAEAKGSGDARLRAAVAAWVAVADTEEREGGSEDEGADAESVAAAAAAGGEQASAAGDADEAADAPQASDAADSGDADSGEGPKGEAPQDAENPEDGASGPAADVEPEAEAETADEPKADVTDVTEAEADPNDVEDATDAQAVGDGKAPENAASKPADAGSDASDVEDAKAPESAAAGAKAPEDAASKPVVDRATGVFRAVKVPVAEEPADAGSDASDVEDAKVAADDAAASEGAASKADVEPDAPTGAKAPEDAASKPVVDRATGVFRAVKPPVVDEPVDAEPGAPADAEPEDAAPEDEAPEPSSEDTTDEPKADAKAPVDQPTAVFKAPRRPAVDQPTTMLKLGDVKPPADKATDKAKPTPTPEPEAEAERTSKFVALKPLDEPAPPKPKGAPAATSGSSTATTAFPQVGPERTTQQPLPPKPPLDLLAELTNTPPRPETPVRTIVRRVKIWTPLAILLAVIFAVVQAVRPLPAPSLTLTADDTYTFKGGELDLPWPGQGQSAIEVEGVGSLGTDGKQTPQAIASVAKIMTAYVILHEHPLKGNEGGPQITVDQQAEDESKNEDESTAAITKGQKFTERQVLQMLMIPSGNNAARLLARWDSDSDTFVGKMNAAAKKLGMTHTTYTDPSGLEKTTVSTATDQLKLAKAVMQDKVFRSIVGMASAQIPGLDKPIYTTNDLLTKQVGVIGLKTGSSTPAGGNLVWAATKTVDGQTQTVYGAVLNQNAGTGRVWDSLQLSLTNSQKLIDKVQKSLTSAMVVKKGDVVGYVDDGLGGSTPVVATKNMKAVGWPGLKTSISIGADGETVPHSAKAGTVVGKLTVGDGSNHAVTIPVALKSALAEPGFAAKLKRVS
ncbi:serine hydrolase [Streptomyces sp. NPDC005485]|uniref:serine hydrolase n=1 Tax=Streptomyces sp. NPDC005485 TaxID=3155591 RepID=UPI0033A69B71